MKTATFWHGAENRILEQSIVWEVSIADAAAAAALAVAVVAAVYKYSRRDYYCDE